MPSDCPKAPLYGPIPQLQTLVLGVGQTLVRFHGNAFPANSFNPNIGKDWAIPEHGARFNPFPNDHSANVPTVYAGDDFAGAALESVFHNVPHIPSPRFLLRTWTPGDTVS
jgi:RES domain